MIRLVRRLLLSHIASALILVGWCFAQEGSKVIELEHADSLVGTEINGERARVLIGNVRFRQGGTVVTCERATQYLTSNRVSLEGVVEVRDSTMRMVGSRGEYDATNRIAEAFDRVLLEDPPTILHASHGKYFANEKKAVFTNNVQVEDTASALTADTLTYYRETQHSIATGNVEIRNRQNNVTILGHRFENYRQRKYSIMTEEPLFFQIDTSSGGKKDTLTVTADTLESFQDSLERLVATDSVKMFRSGLAAEGGVSTFYTRLDSITLFRSPFVWYSAGRYDDNQVSGDSIFIKLNQRKLQTVFVRGRAVAIARADSLYRNRFNQMTGQDMILQFTDNKVQRIDVITTATSLYYLFDQGKGNGLNKTSGDRVTILFSDGRIDKIKVVSGVEGQYVPERLVKGRESDYNLQGFNWREDRPGKQTKVGSKKFEVGDTK